MLKAEPEDLSCFRLSLKDLGCFGQSPKDLSCFGQSPKDLFGTAAAAAEGGRDTRVLGDPMDLIRRQKLPGKAQRHTVQTSTN